MRSIKDMVKDNQQVTFQFYRDRQLWYATECGFEFPVPIEDVGTATFKAQDKAMLFMRYIRKHRQLIESGVTEPMGAKPFDRVETDGVVLHKGTMGP